MNTDEGFVMSVNHEAAADMYCALKDAAVVINAMHAGELPPCFKPTIEMVNAINYAIHKAESA
jgi:hypothetical protein